METLREFQWAQAGALDLVEVPREVFQFQVSGRVILIFLDLTLGFELLHQTPLSAVASFPLESSFVFESPLDAPDVGILQSVLQLRRLMFDKLDKHSI